LYESRDYKGAITEFNAAQRLAPADLNYYNIALCYDKLGDAESAIRQYQEYLHRAPDSARRAEVEANIARLEEARRSAAKKADDDKRAQEAKRADEARQAEEVKRAEEEAKRAEAAKKAEEVKRAEAAKQPADSANGSAPTGSAGAGGPGASGTPSTAQTVTTGDADLDRVASINVDAIRDQNGFGGPSASAPSTNAPSSSGPTAAGPQQSGNHAGEAPPPPKATPVYKQWWFWAVVAVGAVVLYEVATTPSHSTTQASGRETPQPQSNFALLHF